MHLKEINKNDEFWQQWLKKYKSFRCLWDTLLETPLNERLIAWEELIEMAKTANKNADAIYIRGHLKNFIRQYKLEAKKVKAAEANGFKYKPASFSYKIFKSINVARQSGCADEEVPTALKELHPTPERNKERQFWYKFIKKYVSLKCLWDHKITYSKPVRDNAYRKLLKMVKMHHQPGANLKFIKQRINGFRTNYRKELTKINKLKEQGTEYTSNLYYFNLMTPIYQSDCESLEYSSDEEETNDYETDLESVETGSGEPEQKRDNSKNLALFKKLQDKGFICRPFESENLTHSKKVWLKVIKKYVLFKCLWDYKNRDMYKDYEREAAWVELLEIVKTIKPEADLTFVKYRLQSMRANYCRALQKAKEAHQNGVEPEVSLYYFNEISPIYQEGFPILQDEDEYPKREERILNPKFTTYFPDDDNDDDGGDKQEDATELGNNDWIKDNFELVSGDEACDDVSEISFEQNDSLEIFSDQQAEQCIDDKLDEVKNPMQTMTKKSLEIYMPANKHSIGTNTNKLLQSKTTKKQNLNHKRKSTQHYDDYGEKACKISKSSKLSTFEMKIAQHLGEMGTQEYLLAEKLITDVCIYGRLGKLTIESGITLKKIK